jgi:RND family efflux transporter MFP subunit
MSHDKATLDQLRIDRNARSAPRAAPWIIGALAFVLLIGGAVFWWSTRPSVVVVQTVTASEIQSGGQTTLLNASGYVTPRREATVSSKITGKVVEVLVEEGMRVEAGQVLARLDFSNVEASLRLSEAQLAAARSALEETRVRLAEAERELGRTKQLASERVATESDLDRADAEVKSLQARLDQQAAQVKVAEREIALWQQQMEDTIVRAPFAGIVTAKNAQPGEMISPMSAGGFTRTGICTIVDMSSLEIEVDVNESYINRVQAGQGVQATLDAYPDWRIPCRVIAIIPTADRQKATVQVRVGFEKLDPRILPQMGVKVAFQSAGENGAAARAMVLPKSVLQEDTGREYVWIFQSGRLERRAITVAASRNDEITVAAGISTGEKVVLNPTADFAN